MSNSQQARRARRNLVKVKLYGKWNDSGIAVRCQYLQDDEGNKWVRGFFLQRLTLGLIKLSKSQIPKPEPDLISSLVVLVVPLSTKAPHSTVQLTGGNSAKKKYNLLLAGNRFIDCNFSKTI